MTSTERVIEYSQLKPEAPLEKEKEPDTDWPKHGIITFEDVSVSYSDDGPLVLKNLRCCIRAEEKVSKSKNLRKASFTFDAVNHLDKPQQQN